MTLLFNEFIEVENQFRQRETELFQEIDERSELIKSNEREYRKLLSEGNEAAADEMFQEQKTLRSIQESAKAKYENLSVIHDEKLQEQGLATLENDLSELKDLYTSKYEAMVEEQNEFEKMRRRLEEKHDQIAEDMKNDLDGYHKMFYRLNKKDRNKKLLYKPPYSMLRNSVRETLYQVKAKQSEEAEKIK